MVKLLPALLTLLMVLEPEAVAVREATQNIHAAWEAIFLHMETKAGQEERDLVVATDRAEKAERMVLMRMRQQAVVAVAVDTPQVVAKALYGRHQNQRPMDRTANPAPA